MKTINWNDSALRARPLAKPVRVYQPNGWAGFGQHYTAIPLDMLDSIRAMLKACGFKLTTYYVGPRPADSLLDNYYKDRGGKITWSIVAGTTRKSNARYAKIIVEDPKTKERKYL